MEYLSEWWNKDEQTWIPCRIVGGERDAEGANVIFYVKFSDDGPKCSVHPGSVRGRKAAAVQNATR